MKTYVGLALLLAVFMVAIPVASISLSEKEPAPQSGQSSSQAPDPIQEETYQLYDKATDKVLTVPQIDYLKGALATEVPATYQTEALKAQVVATHTYAVRLKKQRSALSADSEQNADFSVDTANWQGYVTEEMAKQRFGDNFVSYWAKITEAVDAVKDQLILYENEPIVAAYHAISPGATEASGVVWQTDTPYLQPVESEGDKLAQGYVSTAAFSSADAKAALTAAFPDIALGDDPAQWFTGAEKSSSGTVTKILAGGKETDGQKLRELFSLRSACFDIAFENDTFTFSVVGYGHGVGLSQNGADYMARQGSNYEDILKHYYTGVTITK